MQSFNWIQTSLSIIVALSVTRLMVSVSNLYIARDKVKGDWIPYIWAICIFFLALQFSWTFLTLGKTNIEWSFGVFLWLLVMVLPLFFAAALILPNTDFQAGGDLTAWFQKNGRVALLCFAFYSIAVYPFNWYFFNLSPVDRPYAGIAALMAIVGYATKSRSVLTLVTLVAFSIVTLFAVRMLIQ